jgi:hypothetical protein
MTPVSFATPSRLPGRPREFAFTPEQELRYCELYLLANKDHKSGSASMAMRVLKQEFPELDWDPYARASKHQLPAAAWELARRAKAVVAYHRQGERGLRSVAGHAKGGMRIGGLGERRLRAGERISMDDGTINIPVVIPWEYGGCELSEQHKVKLGRFQLLQPHDEATSYAPSFEFIIRESQGYRGPDACGTALRFCRDVCRPDNFVFEGGVWQGTRMQRVIEGLGVGLIDVKGRPNQKLVENFFNRMWTRLGMEKGLASVGRFRGEEKEVSEFYVKCRAGKADPRGKFPWLHDLLAGIENTIRWLNADRIESPQYGKWVPEERWARDMEEFPRPPVQDVKLWLSAPVMERRKVSRHMVSVRTTGFRGLKMTYAFTGPCLLEWEGRQVEIYFDPLASWPLQAVIAKPGTAVAIGTAECANPYHEGGTGHEAAKNLREVMRREYRLLWQHGRQLDTSARETSVRGMNGTIEINTLHRSASDQGADREKNHGENRDAAAVPEPRHTTVAEEVHPAAPPWREAPPEAGRGRVDTPFDTAAAREGSVLISRTTRGGVDPSLTPAAEPLRSLGRRAAAAREQQPNW